jgi:TonB family protein
MWLAVLADLAVKSTAVFAAAWMVALLLRRRSAAARHLVWTAAAAAVLALPFLSVSLPGLPVRGAGAILPGSVVFRITATAGAGAPPMPVAALSRSVVQTQPAPWHPDWPLWLALIWMAGAVALGAQMLMACITMSRVRRSAEPWPEGGLGAGQVADILQTPAGTMPMTYGILRPVVFLPEDAAQWNDDLRRAVLLHELAHVRRGDVATQMLARLAVTLHWWNPLAWTAWRQFLKERERAADDMVLGAGERASDYAGHLLQMARSRQAAPALAWAAVCMARRSQLEARLVAILDTGANRAAVGRGAAWVAAAMAAALVAPLAAVRAEKTAPRALAPVVAFAVRAIAPESAPAAPEAPAAAAAVPELQDRSVAYGVGLLKIADRERKRRQAGEAEAFYTKAAAVLGDRPEAARAWMYLGIRKKDPAEALACLRKVERLDPAQAGPARMWMAVMLERQHRLDESEGFYKSALVAEKSGSAEAVGTLRLYARLLREQGRDGEAESLEKQAAAVRWHAVHGQGVFRVGEGVKPPALLSKVEPEYSDEARAAKFQGTVVIYAEIGADGLAHNTHVIQGLGLGLDEKALEAINRWRFRPGSKDGSPVTVAATIEVNFRLL